MTQKARKQEPPSEADCLRIAAEADVDPRTVRAYFTEPDVERASKARKRIEAAVQKLRLAKGGG